MIYSVWTVDTGTWCHSACESLSYWWLNFQTTYSLSFICCYLDISDSFCPLENYIYSDRTYVFNMIAVTTKRNGVIKRNHVSFFSHLHFLFLTYTYLMSTICMTFFSVSSSPSICFEYTKLIRILVSVSNIQNLLKFLVCDWSHIHIKLRKLMLFFLFLNWLQIGNRHGP